MKRFEKLLEPGCIGSLKIKNRMIKSGATARYWGDGEDQVSDRTKHYYESFARGGIGLVIVESPSLIPNEARMKGNYRLDDDKYIKGLSELTALIHKHDCPAFIQFNHNIPGSFILSSTRVTYLAIAVHRIKCLYVKTLWYYYLPTSI